jgi:hypothetical protein
VPCLCELYPGICLTTEGKARINLSQDSRRDSKNTHCQDTHTLQNICLVLLFFRPPHSFSFASTTSLSLINFCFFVTFLLRGGNLDSSGIRLRAGRLTNRGYLPLQGQRFSDTYGVLGCDAV